MLSGRTRSQPKVMYLSKHFLPVLAAIQYQEAS